MPVLQGAPPAGQVDQQTELIGSITYRSRANGKPTWAELDALTRSAQQRNRAAGLTGMLLYEDGRFFQWIEGPPDKLEPVWQSIRGDARHREIDVMSMRVCDHRMFAGWDMRWMRRGERAKPGDPPAAGLDFLEPVAPSERLARLALGGDEDAIGAELDRSYPRTPLAALLDYAIEPTARVLGDAWLRDDIDELALTCALSRLNRLVHDRATREAPTGEARRSLLAATLPGEAHILGAVAAAELHLNAGWTVALEFPASIDALLHLVRAKSYDRVDIATSDALDRGARGTALELAARIKRASRNPAVEISFGGRAFWADATPNGLAYCTYRSTAAAFRL